MTTRPQHLQALAKAQTTRLARAALRRRIEAAKTYWTSRHECATVLLERHDSLESARVWDVLGWIHKMNTATVRGLLRHAGVYDDYRRVGQLTDRQLLLLVEGLRDPSLVRIVRAAA